MTILWTAQTHCALWHSPTVSTVHQRPSNYFFRPHLLAVWEGLRRGPHSASPGGKSSGDRQPLPGKGRQVKEVDEGLGVLIRVHTPHHHHPLGPCLPPRHHAVRMQGSRLLTFTLHLSQTMHLVTPSYSVQLMMLFFCPVVIRLGVCQLYLYCNIVSTSC